MKKKVKIIQLTRFGLEKNEHHPKPHEDLFYLASWGGLLARRLIKKFPDLDIEVWRTEDSFDQLSERIIQNFKAVIFPYKNVLFKQFITWRMLKKLFQYQKQYSLILHIHEIHTPFTYFAPFLLTKTKIILHNRGVAPPITNSLKHIIKRNVEKIAYPKIHRICYLNFKIKDYFNLYIKNSKIAFVPTGCDFNQFKPMDKTECRKRLNLKNDTVYALYVGYFYKLKGVDIILKTYHKLKDKYNFSILFIGGINNEQNDFYKEVENSGCHYFNFLPWEELISYYNAADFYIHPSFHPDFYGLDNTWMEALACGKPVASSVLKSLDFDYSELGINIDSIEKVDAKIEWMINNFSKFKNCREVAKKHLDGNNTIMEKIYDIYFS